jgi:lipoprotein
MKLKFLAPALLAGLLAFTSCSKDDKKEEPAQLHKEEQRK